MKSKERNKAVAIHLKTYLDICYGVNFTLWDECSRQEHNKLVTLCNHYCKLANIELCHKLTKAKMQKWIKMDKEEI